MQPLRPRKSHHEKSEILPLCAGEPVGPSRKSRAWRVEALPFCFFFVEQKVESPPSSLSSFFVSPTSLPSLKTRAPPSLSLSLLSERDSPLLSPSPRSGRARFNFFLRRELPPLPPRGKPLPLESRGKKGSERASKRRKKTPYEAEERAMPTTISDADHSRWRAGAPLLYDWLSNQSLLWPSLSCR